MQEAADRFFQPQGPHRIARGGNRREGNGFFAFLFDPELLTGLPVGPRYFTVSVS
jgi:hypothetical protein